MPLNQFTQMVKRINSEVLALKTNKLRTSSSIAVDSYSQSVSLEWQLEDDYFPFVFINYNVYADLANNNPAFAQITFSDLTSLFNKQNFDTYSTFRPPMDNGYAVYDIMIYSDDPNIIQSIRNGQTVTFDTTISVTATEPLSGIRLEKLPWPQ